MKKIFWLFLFLTQITLVSAQNNDKYDQVLMLNGEEKIGTVTGMDNETISFKFKGETLEYKLKKSDIFRIKFASGRTELFSTSNLGESEGANRVTSDTNTVMKANSIAILPFRFVTANRTDNQEEMSMQIQSDYYSYASASSGNYSYQDPMKTNALLRKKGISPTTVKTYEADELCDMLGVEYVVLGSVERNKTGTTSTANASGTTQKKGTTDNSNATINSSSSEEFKTIISISIYNNKDEKVFDQKKTSFWSSVNAYKSSLNYLIKRTPFYQK